MDGGSSGEFTSAALSLNLSLLGAEAARFGPASLCVCQRRYLFCNALAGLPYQRECYFFLAGLDCANLTTHPKCGDSSSNPPLAMETYDGTPTWRNRTRFRS